MDLFGCFENGLGCVFGLCNDGIEFMGGVDEVVVCVVFVFDVGNFGFGVFDGFVYVCYIELNFVEIGNFMLVGDYFF